MKMKKVITRILVLVIAITLGIVTSQSFATAGTKNLQLSYLRYVYSYDSGEYVATNGYALNTKKTSVDEGKFNRPIYQILSVDDDKRTGTNYYCLNAEAGAIWRSGTVGTTVTYNQYYDLETEKSEIAKLSNNVYSDIANSDYYKQIVWILDNMYVLNSLDSADTNLSKKNELLENAGLSYTLVDEEDIKGESANLYGYRYLKSDATDKGISERAQQGYFYYDTTGTYQMVDFPDELVESTQQAALWYFTNYLDNNSEKSETYNATAGLELVWSNGSTTTDTGKWNVLDNYKVATKDSQADVGKWQQEMATILYNYLIDSANTYASSETDTSTGTPVSVANSSVGIATKTIEDKNYYVLGPIKINEDRVAVYNLNKILVNSSESTGAYISDANGITTDKSLNDVVGSEFYVTVPTSEVTGNSVTIDFMGTYKTNEKLLWVATGTEQPVVEVTSKDKEIDLTVSAPIQKEFDLALQKYISNITSNGTTIAGRTAPTINTKKLANREATTATYTQDKTPIQVKSGDYVTYTFTVYNEGDIDGYVNKITDNIPTGLQFVYQKDTDGKTLIACDSQGNMTEIEVDSTTYKIVENNSYWSIDQNSGSILKDTYNGETTASVTCDVTSFLGGTNKLLNAYDSSKDPDYDGSGLSSVNVTLVLRVSAEDGSGVTIRNEAAITEAEDKDGNKQDTGDLKDRDSQINKWEGKDVGTDGSKNYQDDEDYDNIILGTVDLALTKFIAAVSDDTEITDGEYLTSDGKVGSKTNPYTRATGVNTVKLRDDENCHDATYITVKDPLVVPAKSYVLYDIRVYNEGDVDVYAGEVTDHLPEYLDFVTCEFNDNYGWTVGSDGKTIKTSYLSYEKGKDNLLKAFDKTTDDGKGSGLDYRDLQVLCKVNDNAPTNTNIVNVAEITKYEDENGNDITEDVDSKPNNVDEKNEDDDDYEVVLIKTFDLSLLKYVSTVYVTEDGVTTETQTGNTGDDKTDIIPKVEINRKKLSSTVVKFGYTIKITNEGDIAGYAKEITDYVPEGLKFYAEDNNGWTDEGNNVISTKLLENTLLQPGESAEVTVIFRWINGSENLGLKTNVAEISKDYNEEGIPDRDSTPDNRVEGEDDIDDAQVLLSIKTGSANNIIMYITAGAVMLIVFGTGIILIKKYVL